MKLLVLLCCVLSTALAVPVRRSLLSKEILPIVLSQRGPALPQFPGFVQFPQFPGAVPFSQVAMPQQAMAQVGPWNRLLPASNNIYGFPLWGMPQPVGDTPSPVGGRSPPAGGMPSPVRK